MIEKETEQKEIEYNEIYVSGFPEAMERVIGEYNDESFRFLFTDIDGTLVEDGLIKYPFVSHFVDPEIKKDTERAFQVLSILYHPHLAIVTNRNRKEKVFWNSDKVIKSVIQLIKSTRTDIRMFERMQKQIPPAKRIEELVEYIKAQFVNSGYDNEIIIDSIEDLSFVSFNRKTFLRKVAEALEENLGVSVRVNNYVIDN